MYCEMQLNMFNLLNPKYSSVHFKQRNFFILKIKKFLNCE